MTAPMPRLSLAGALALCAACVTSPPPTRPALRLAQNPRATIGGRVTDADGRPVAGARVQAVPGGKDILWSPEAPTDADGRFQLSVDAPAEYVFLVFVDSVAVVTASPRDPARVRVFVNPGETLQGVALTLLGEEREKLVTPGE